MGKLHGVVLSVLLVASLLVCGCGAKEVPTPTPRPPVVVETVVVKETDAVEAEPSDTAEPPRSLVVWVPDWAEEEWYGVAGLYEEQYGRRVEVQARGSLTDVHAMLFEAVAVGELPDVVLIEAPVLLPLAEQGVLRDFSDTADSWREAGYTVVNLQGFIPGLFDRSGLLVVALDTPQDSWAVADLLYVAGEYLESGRYRYVPGEVVVLAYEEIGDEQFE